VKPWRHGIILRASPIKYRGMAPPRTSSTVLSTSVPRQQSFEICRQSVSSPRIGSSRSGFQRAAFRLFIMVCTPGVQFSQRRRRPMNARDDRAPALLELALGAQQRLV
jgi:hypothetical protein